MVKADEGEVTSEAESDDPDNSTVPPLKQVPPMRRVLALVTSCFDAGTVRVGGLTIADFIAA